MRRFSFLTRSITGFTLELGIPLGLYKWIKRRSRQCLLCKGCSAIKMTVVFDVGIQKYDLLGLFNFMSSIQILRFFFEMHSQIKAPRKKISSKKDRTEAPITSPSHPPIFAENNFDQIKCFYFAFFNNGVIIR